ncbi:MAG: hypothetical protein Q4E54_07575 [Lachnospiraceae bacterium]|nr:hypothetical protein [Lachnospiraceae bacterium]
MPIIEVDCHGLNTEQAVNKVRETVNKADSGTYRIRVIHGYNGGTRIKSAIKEEFSYGREPKILRIEPGDNMGVTDLIIREY